MSEMTKGENVVSANPIHAKKERDISGFQEKINPILNMITAFLCIVTVLVMLIEPLFVLSNKKDTKKYGEINTFGYKVYDGAQSKGIQLWEKYESGELTFVEAAGMVNAVDGRVGFDISLRHYEVKGIVLAFFIFTLVLSIAVIATMWIPNCNISGYLLAIGSLISVGFIFVLMGKVERAVVYNGYINNLAELIIGSLKGSSFYIGKDSCIGFCLIMQYVFLNLGLIKIEITPKKKLEENN